MLLLREMSHGGVLRVRVGDEARSGAERKGILVKNAWNEGGQSRLGTG